MKKKKIKRSSQSKTDIIYKERIYLYQKNIRHGLNSIDRSNYNLNIEMMGKKSNWPKAHKK